MAFILASGAIILISWFVLWVFSQHEDHITLEHLAPEVEASPFLLHADNDNFGD